MNYEFRIETCDRLTSPNYKFFHSQQNRENLQFNFYHKKIIVTVYRISSKLLGYCNVLLGNKRQALHSGLAAVAQGLSIGMGIS